MQSRRELRGPWTALEGLIVNSRRYQKFAMNKIIDMFGSIKEEIDLSFLVNSSNRNLEIPSLIVQRVLRPLKNTSIVQRMGPL